MIQRPTTSAILVAVTAIAGVAAALLLPRAGRGFGLGLVVVAVVASAAMITRRVRRSRWQRLSDSDFLASALLVPGVSPELGRMVRATLARILDQPTETVLPSATLDELLSRNAWFGTETMDLDELYHYLAKSCGISEMNGSVRVADIVNRAASIAPR